MESRRPNGAEAQWQDRFVVGFRRGLAVLLHEREIRWHVLDGDAYRVLPPDAEVLLRSRIFPGLWLDGQALLAGDMAMVLKRLQDGLQSPEHRQFVERLAATRESRGV